MFAQLFPCNIQQTTAWSTGWEVKQHAAADYWRQWPAEDRYKMHFYNTPFDTDQTSPDYPLNILKRIYKPGDFVVIKLDVDTEALELAFMKAIQEWELGPSIAEIFWEQHFNVPEMERHFHYKMAANWTDGLALFREFRMKGLRLHYWP